MTKNILTVLVILAAVTSARASNLTDVKPKSTSASQALKSFKAGQSIFKCSSVTLEETKSGAGLSFKKIKGSKDFLTLGFEARDVIQVLESENVFRCNEVIPNPTRSGISFKNKPKS